MLQHSLKQLKEPVTWDGMSQVFGIPEIPKRFETALFTPWNLHCSYSAKSISAHPVWSGCITALQSNVQCWGLDNAAWAEWSNSMFFPIVFFFFHFRTSKQTSPHLLQLLRRMLQHCFVVNLQTYFVDCKTSICVSVRRNLNFWVTLSFKLISTDDKCRN